MQGEYAFIQQADLDPDLTPEVKDPLGQGSSTECATSDQGTEQSPSQAVKSPVVGGVKVSDVRVPDPLRRSRLNQITGGLLNKLQKKADQTETSSAS